MSADAEQVRVELFDSRRQCGHTEDPLRSTWCPHDQMEGRVVVSTKPDLRVDKISVSLLGFSRVWALVSLPTEIPRCERTAYKFLHQSLSVSTPEMSEDGATERTQHVASFKLTIPDSVLPKTGGIPDQCLSPPPTISVGEILEGQDRAIYAQPRVDYRLSAIANLRSPQDALKKAYSDMEITVMPCSEASPPVDVADFPGEFVGSDSNVFRASFLGAQYRMTLSMSEPSPMSMASVEGRHVTTLHLTVEIQRAAGRETCTNLYTLPISLKDLKFKIQPVLRAKTYYSTQPFTMMPGQAMVRERGPTRLHDHVLKLSEVELVSSSWQPKFLDDVPRYEDAVRMGSFSSGSSNSSVMRCDSQSSTPLPNGATAITAWTTSLSVPVELNGPLMRTFCSAIASRQYSLIARVRVKGAPVKEFVLEAPLQVHRLPCAAAPATSEENERLRRESVREMAPPRLHDLLHGYLTDEELPDYS